MGWWRKAMDKLGVGQTPAVHALRHLRHDGGGWRQVQLTDVRPGEWIITQLDYPDGYTSMELVKTAAPPLDRQCFRLTPRFLGNPDAPVDGLQPVAADDLAFGLWRFLLSAPEPAPSLLVVYVTSGDEAVRRLVDRPGGLTIRLCETSNKMQTMAAQLNGVQ